MPFKNKEEKKEYQKQYYQEHKIIKIKKCEICDNLTQGPMFIYCDICRDNNLQKSKERNIEQGREYRKRNSEQVKRKDRERWMKPERKRSVKNTNLKREYGININDYDEMLKEQNENCAICGRHQSEFKKPLAIDHCHKTGKIRGLLCGYCNMSLGNFNDDIDVLASAISYLQQ